MEKLPPVTGRSLSDLLENVYKQSNNVQETMEK